ncbi:MAG: hypothetical protein R6W73_02660 [Candidatus Saliniplasma sp.]
MSYKEIKNHPIRAAIFAILSLILFVALIWFGVSMATTMVPEIEHIFQNTAMYAVLIGIPLAITIGITNYFGKGDKRRLVFGLISTGVLIIYFVMILRSINLGFEGDEYSYTLTITGIIVLTVIACAIRGVFYVLEFHTYKKELESEQASEKKQGDVQYY